VSGYYVAGACPKGGTHVFPHDTRRFGRACLKCCPPDPPLTTVDRQVLDSVKDAGEGGASVQQITVRAIRRRGRRTAPTPEEREEVEQILRGLERYGLVRLRPDGRWE
jgi:hypothetical protein